MARIDFKDIAHSYQLDPTGENDFALQRLNMHWTDGGAYALLGPSGCGKTTLLNIISGLINPTQGSILFDNQDVTKLAPEARNIAQVFQFPVIYDTMSVYQNLAFPLVNRKLPAEEIEQRVKRIADMLQLTDSLPHKARGLAADAKQKISLGRGLVRSDVAAILFDEPLTVIDPQLKWSLRSELKRLHAEFGRTMIYVTHDQTEALTFADQVIVMSQGRVLQEGTPQALFERPAHTFVGRFVGSPGMNVLPCALEGRKISIAGCALELPREIALPQGPAKIELGVRPEFVRFAEGANTLPVCIESIEDAGSYKIARLRLNDLPLAATLHEHAAPPGDNPRVLFDPAHIHIYADERLVMEGA